MQHQRRLKACALLRKWFRESKREGIEESHLKFYSNLKKAKLNDNTICSYMGITMQKLMGLKKLLSASGNFEPKTV